MRVGSVHHQSSIRPELVCRYSQAARGQEFEKFNRHIIEESERLKPHQARVKRKGKPAGKIRQEESEEDEQNDSGTNTGEQGNRGTLKVDATVADQEIKYPNDVSLLNESRRHLERMIEELYEESIDGKRPRLYPRKARKEYLGFSKKRRKSKRIRRGIKAQLQYVRRDLKVIDSMLGLKERTRRLNDDDRVMLEVIKKSTNNKSGCTITTRTPSAIA